MEEVDSQNDAVTVKQQLNSNGEKQVPLKPNKLKKTERTPQAYLPPKGLQNRAPPNINRAAGIDKGSEVEQDAPTPMNIDSSSGNRLQVKEATEEVEAMAINNDNDDGFNIKKDANTTEDELVDIMSDDKDAGDILDVNELLRQREELLEKRRSLLKKLGQVSAPEIEPPSQVIPTSNPKRKRGRPRKPRPGDIPEPAPAPAPTSSTKKRKRGRPKKGDLYESGFYRDTLLNDHPETSSGKRPRCTWSLEESKFLLSLFERGMTDPHELFEEFQKLPHNSKTFDHVKNKKCNLFAKASQRRVSVVEVLREDIKKLVNVIVEPTDRSSTPSGPPTKRRRPRRRSVAENGGEYNPPAAPLPDEEYLANDTKKPKRNIYRRRYYDGDVDGAIDDAMQEIRFVISDKFHQIHEIMVQQKNIMDMMARELIDIKKRLIFSDRREDVPVTQAEEVVPVKPNNTTKETRGAPVTDEVAPLTDVTMTEAQGKNPDSVEK